MQKMIWMGTFLASPGLIFPSLEMATEGQSSARTSSLKRSLTLRGVFVQVSGLESAPKRSPPQHTTGFPLTTFFPTPS